MELGRISRSGFYRFDGDAKPGLATDMDLRDAIQRIALQWPELWPGDRVSRRNFDGRAAG